MLSLVRAPRESVLRLCSILVVLAVGAGLPACGSPSSLDGGDGGDGAVIDRPEVGGSDGGIDTADVPTPMDAVEAGDSSDGSVPLCPNANESRCGTQCIQPLTDPANCGGCGTRCTAGQVCSSGVCTNMGCSMGLTDCAGACVDTMSSNLHCGGCARACRADQVCSGGTCVCATGSTACASTCVNTATDPAHCGACGTACAAGQVCSAGRCSSMGCTMGLTDWRVRAWTSTRARRIAECAGLDVWAARCAPWALAAARRARRSAWAGASTSPAIARIAALAATHADPGRPASRARA